MSRWFFFNFAAGRGTPVREEDQSSMRLAAAVSGIRRYGPIKSAKYIYPATITEVPR